MIRDFLQAVRAAADSKAKRQVVYDFDFYPMSVVRLKIDISGTRGDEVWRGLRQFDQIQSAAYGPQFGSSGRCGHPQGTPHAKGEWMGAEIRLQTPLLAQYAVSHYLEQDRVLDADVLEEAQQA